MTSLNIALWFYVIGILLGLSLAVVWFFVPFAIFGTKAKLDAIAVELRKLNENIEAAQRRSA
ncbi:hypothetical protein [Dokdonella sp.]|uniref:hypothetical protein n=1 Tax=Dokdonella sp. TaxID=2291710 RepID=UPI001B190313|nr:hypothetical protein [Dokdonella sp.]MBO9662949.1 hypothetical protein [Dokdonella sp.]